MRSPRLRISLAKAMAFVVIAAVAMAGVRFLSKAFNEWRYSTSHGWNTSVLAVGDRVVAIDDVRVGSRVVPTGTPFLVVSDMTDEDSAYSDRKVEVRLPDDLSPGSTFEVERIRLRVQ